MESSLPLFYLGHKHVQKSILYRGIKIATNKWMSARNVKLRNKLNQTMREKHDKAYYKTSTNMSIEHQHSLQLNIVLSMSSQNARKIGYQITEYHLSCV